MINASYAGPERRRRRVYITKNHEYHCLDGVCIAVRDVDSEAFVRGHAALGKRVSSALRLGGDGIESISPPDQAHAGECIHFAEGVEDPHDVLTSPVKKIERPTPEVIAQYELH